MNVLITGASRGIGRSLALSFAAQKNTKRLFLLSRDEKKLIQLKEEITAEFSEVEIVLLPFSLEDETCFGAVQNELRKHIAHLDVLVNNAGYLLNRPFEQISLVDLERVYRINAHAPYLLVQCALPFLGGESRSHVVNIGSMGGVQGQSKFAGLSAYSPSKMALAGVTECLAEELKEKNIFVNCLALGAVNTEMLAEAFPGYQAPISSSQMAEYIAEFATSGHYFYNGKILPVASATP